MNVLRTFTITFTTLLLGAAAAWGAASDMSQSGLYGFADGVPIPGTTSALVRTDMGVTVVLRTHSLPAGDAVTLWMIVFNAPDACQYPTPVSACSDPDIENPAVLADVVYTTGTVIGAAGRATFAGHRLVGDNSGSIFVPLLPPGVQSPGLIYPRSAEIHFIVHTHGPKLPEYMPDMIQTYGGGCMDPGAPFIGLHFPEWGRQGPNTCESLQFAVHRAGD